MLKQVVFVVAILFASVHVTSASAQVATLPSESPAFKFEMFDLGMDQVQNKRWLAETQLTGMATLDNRNLALYGGTVGVGFYVFNSIAFVLDASAYGYNLGHSNGPAVAAAFALRHHMFDIYDTRFYMQVAGGCIWADNNLPRGGTHLNNTIQYGLGIQHPIGKDVYLDLGVDYFHISNARSEGPARNPSANAIQGIVGVIWRF